MKAPKPRDVTELKSFLGMLNYYAKFTPNLSMHMAPLYVLLKKGCVWFWSDQCEKAFSMAKQLLVSSEVLVHYNPQLPLRLAADASSYGVGAVISHQLPDGSERPIAYASRSLTDAECRYAQVEKEALAIVFGIKKLHQY